MSIFWDPKARQPQIWVYGFFIFLTIAVFAGIYFYGESKMNNKEASSDQVSKEFK